MAWKRSGVRFPSAPLVRVWAADGSLAVVSTNPNGAGSVYYEAPSRHGQPVSAQPQRLQEAGKGRQDLGQSLVEVTLPAIEGLPEGQPIPVQINPLVTELGNLELWMKHTGSDRRWKVEFQVRME